MSGLDIRSGDERLVLRTGRETNGIQRTVIASRPVARGGPDD
ncbi:hypothetical protein [Streptomyces sp. H51]|nr:hypothetical protein [Streptomyces sp. H51]